MYTTVNLACICESRLDLDYYTADGKVKVNGYKCNEDAHREFSKQYPCTYDQFARAIAYAQDREFNYI